MTQLTLFYDATCPLCVKEMDTLKRLDKNQALKMVDIYSEEISAYPQIDIKQAGTILHALDESQQLILGLDAVHRAWQLVGKGWIYAPLRWRLIKPLADKAYLYFAKHRYRFSFWLTGTAKCNNNQCSH
ncbi:DUF393 domain-containing protein [Vibrio metschnikovii]|uniref:thiol-disulfide oxidoreductase DCC family protein n=1 Tax=Vibrio metschnikovii TaxID=28172 RepID=UPI002FC78F2B